MSLAHLPADDYTADNWRDYAACKGVDPDLFHPPRGGDHQRALRVCRACPVADHCLEYALSVNPRDDQGIWGGTSQEQRKRLRKSRGITTVTVPRDTTRQPAGCGTDAGYQRHRRNNEPVCDACRAAHTLDRQHRKAGR